jgi:hypothetical protein
LRLERLHRYAPRSEKLTAYSDAKRPVIPIHSGH